MIIIPKEIKKEITFMGIKVKYVFAIISPFIIMGNFSNLISKFQSPVSMFVSSIFIMFLLIPFSYTAFFYTIINNIKYLFEKKTYYVDRNIFVENKYKYVPTKYAGKNIFKRLMICVKNTKLKHTLKIQKYFYLLTHAKEKDMRSSIFFKSKFEWIGNNLVLTTGTSQYVIKKITPAHSNFFYSDNENKKFFQHYYNFIRKFPNLKIYIWHDLPTSPLKSGATTDVKNLSKIEKLVYNWNKTKIESYNQDMQMRIYTVEAYELKTEYPNYHSEILIHSSITEEDIPDLQLHLFNNIENVNSVVFNNSNLELIKDENKDIIKFLTINDLAVVQEELFLEKLFTRPEVSARIDFEICDSLEMKSVIDKAVNEANERQNDTEKMSVFSREKQDVDKLIEYLQALNNQTDVIIKFNIQLRLIGRSEEEVEKLAKVIIEEHPNLQIKDSLFVQQEMLKKWNLIN